MLQNNQYKPPTLTYNQSESLNFFTQNMSQFENNK